jgi:hypothetical protein
MGWFTTLSGVGWIITPLGLQLLANPPFVADGPVRCYACSIFFGATQTTLVVQDWYHGYTQQDNLNYAMSIAQTIAPTLNPNQRRNSQ